MNAFLNYIKEFLKKKKTNGEIKALKKESYYYQH